MNEHDLYMADFMKVFETLEYWGPGDETDTQKALSLVPAPISSILEVGCGKGLATKVLAERCQAHITALDNEQSALDKLVQRLEQQGLSGRLTTVNASMTELPFSHDNFDLIWAEGSAYIMGVEDALTEWKPFLHNPGYMVLSDMVWRTSEPSKESEDLWSHEYPDIQLVETRIKQIQKAGYQVISHFPQSEKAWLNYYVPLGERLRTLESSMPTSSAVQDIKREVDICTRFSDEFGYHMFIIAKC